MKDRLWTKQYLLVIVTNFLLYVVYYQLMLWTTSYAMHIWKADVSEAGLAAGLFIISAYRRFGARIRSALRHSALCRFHAALFLHYVNARV